MPTDVEHHKQKEHNKAFAEFVKNSGSLYHDWAIIGLFYAAIHEIERYAFVKCQYHSMSHPVRNNFVSRALKPIWNNYRELSEMSRDIRYECYSPTSADLEKAETFVSHIETHINQMTI